MSDAAFLDVAGLSAGYGRSQALFDVSLKVPARGAIAVLGRNGAGKSTLLKALFGELLEPIKAHCALIIVEHDLHFIRDICDHLTVLDQGRVLDHGDVETIQRSPKVQQVFTTRV